MADTVYPKAVSKWNAVVDAHAEASADSHTYENEKVEVLVQKTPATKAKTAAKKTEPPLPKKPRGAAPPPAGVRPVDVDDDAVVTEEENEKKMDSVLAKMKKEGVEDAQIAAVEVKLRKNEQRFICARIPGPRGAERRQRRLRSRMVEVATEPLAFEMQNETKWTGRVSGPRLTSRIAEIVRGPRVAGRRQAQPAT